jgi:hypothetical protein
VNPDILPSGSVGVMYSAYSAELHSIVQWLRGDDEAGWLDQIELLAGTVFDLKAMARPMIRKTVVPPEAMAISVALHQLARMTAAMQRRERIPALECGQTALALLIEE